MFDLKKTYLKFTKSPKGKFINLKIRIDRAIFILLPNPRADPGEGR
jgi:hypothetical protein